MCVCMPYVCSYDSGKLASVYCCNNGSIQSCHFGYLRQTNCCNGERVQKLVCCVSGWWAAKSVSLHTMFVDNRLTSYAWKCGWQLTPFRPVTRCIHLVGWSQCPLSPQSQAHWSMWPRPRLCTLYWRHSLVSLCGYDTMYSLHAISDEVNGIQVLDHILLSYVSTYL